MTQYHPNARHNSSGGTMQSESSHDGGGTVQSVEQRDRSLTVLIPRAKFRPVPVPLNSSCSLLTMSTFGPEQKIINYPSHTDESYIPEKKVS